jgi:hypothetical protein
VLTVMLNLKINTFEVKTFEAMGLLSYMTVECSCRVEEMEGCMRSAAMVILHFGWELLILL